MKYKEFIEHKPLQNKIRQIAMNSIHPNTRKKVERLETLIDNILFQTDKRGNRDFDFQNFKKTGLRMT